MKVFKGIYPLIIITVFFMSGVAYSQSSAKESAVKGMNYAVLGKFTKAKKEFNKSLKTDPSYSPAKLSLKIIEDVKKNGIRRESALHLFKGSIHNYKGQRNLAVEEFTKAIEIDPKYAVSYYSRGTIYNKIGEYDKAISNFTKVIKLSPKYDGAYSNRAISYHKKGLVDRAIRDYSKAIKMDPKDAQSYSSRGVAYFVNLRKKSKGCADFYKGCELGSCRNYIAAREGGDCREISKNRSMTTKVPCKVILAEWTRNGSVIAPKGCNMLMQGTKATPYCNGKALTNDSCGHP